MKTLAGKIKKNCSHCNKEMLRFPCTVKNRKHIFCSKKCMHDFQVGANNPCYRGGVMKIKGYERYRVRKKELKKRGVDTSKSFNFIDWVKLKIEYNFMCPSCKKSEPEIHLTVDHIIPISKGGTDEIGNIQPLCHSCNSRKNKNTIKF